jgi:uncharacterized repeat protein (TIGR01451 family)
VTKALAAGARIGEVRSIIPLSADESLALTDFFDLKDAGEEGKKCVVYRCLRQDGEWLIRAIELKDVGGLVVLLRSVQPVGGLRRRVVPASAPFPRPNGSRPSAGAGRAVPPGTSDYVRWSVEASDLRGHRPWDLPQSAGGLTVKATGPNRRRAGDVAEFAIAVSNRGSEPLTNVVVTDLPDDGLQPRDASQGFVFNGRGLRWELDRLAPGESKTLQLRVKCPGAPGKAYNWVAVTADGGLRVGDGTRVETYLDMDDTATSAADIEAEATEKPAGTNKP